MNMPNPRDGNQGADSDEGNQGSGDADQKSQNTRFKDALKQGSDDPIIIDKNR